MGETAMQRRLMLALSACLVLPVGIATAQSPAPSPSAAQPARLRGVVNSVSATTLEMTLRDGAKATATLPENLRVSEMRSAKLSDIQAESYVGSAAVPQPDGTLRALQVTIFPPAARGAGEGHRPWDLVGNSTMTNGTVGSMTTGTVGSVGGGQDVVLTVRYAGGEQRILVPEDVPVVTFGPGERAMVVPGAQIILSGSRAADGSVTATSITVGKDGLVPPN
jgi:hypothetical protein